MYLKNLLSLPTVRKVFSIILTSLILFQGAGFGMEDMLLLGKLAEHARYHSENYGDDFLTFFNKHYGNLRTEHSDDSHEKSEHEKLPFQHHSCNHAIAEVILTEYECPVEKPIGTVFSKPNFFYKNLYNSLEKVSIFQPPKFA